MCQALASEDLTNDAVKFFVDAEGNAELTKDGVTFYRTDGTSGEFDEDTVGPGG